MHVSSPVTQKATFNSTERCGTIVWSDFLGSGAVDGDIAESLKTRHRKQLTALLMAGLVTTPGGGRTPRGLLFISAPNKRL
jgi:hypothetical protein